MLIGKEKRKMANKGQNNNGKKKVNEDNREKKINDIVNNHIGELVKL